MVTRRDFLAIAGASALLIATPGCRAGNLPLKGVRLQEEAYEALPSLGLATSLRDEHDYTAELKGTLPPDLTGTLYRNGPGLFERAGLRKRCLLDGDGMIQAFAIREGTVRFRNRFVRTRKFRKEEAAGRYLYTTWSTQAPGGIWANLGGGTLENQAGVSVVMDRGRLYAFDEFHPPYELDPETLATRGVSWLGQPEGSTVFSAHSKRDLRSVEWIFFGLEFGVRPKLHLTVLGADGALRMHRVHPLSSNVYMHDFFATERHIVVHLHPVEISPVPVLSGVSSITGAMRWKPSKGSTVLVFDREGEENPMQLEAEPSWMWHTLNAYETGGEIVADFVGYRHPDHFLGRDPALFAIMEGRQGTYESPGELRRFVIDRASGRLRQGILSSQNHDFPYLHPGFVCHRHRFGYFLRISEDALFFDEIVRVDMEAGKTSGFRFESGQYCTEPVFAPDPRSPQAEEAGWLLSQVYDSRKKRSFLAVFQAEKLADGPIAEAWLHHHVPLGFHGFWQASPRT